MHSLQIKMQENVSILETIVADMPDLFYAEILPKLGLFETLNLAKVSKKYRDLVWWPVLGRSRPRLRRTSRRLTCSREHRPLHLTLLCLKT